MDIRYENGGISSIKTSIKVKDVKTIEEKNRFLNLMRYFTEIFIQEMELNKAEELIEYAKKYNIDISTGIVIKHSKGAALCNISNFGIGKNKIQVTPFISLYSPSFLSGWTFSRGNMSDVNICAEDIHFDGYVSLITRDTLYEHDLYLHWVISKVEETFYTNFECKTYELENNCFLTKTIGYNQYDDYKLYEFLVEIVKNNTILNKKIRIDKLKVNGLTAKEYIFNHKIWRFCHTENQLWKMCLFFNKPYEQVHKFVENNGIS